MPEVPGRFHLLLGRRASEEVVIPGAKRRFSVCPPALARCDEADSADTPDPVRQDPVTQGGRMSEASFDRVISEHLALSERNRRLERRMPLDSYRDQLHGDSAPDASPGTPPRDESTEPQEHWLDTESFWDTTGERPLPEFDWGDD